MTPLGTDANLLLLSPDAIFAAVEVLVAEDAQLLGKPQLSATEVHRVRVNGKKLRAWIRLVRLGGDHKRCSKAECWLRSTSRSLAEGRDARVRMETLAWLATRTSSASTRAALALLSAPVDDVAGVTLPEPVSAAQAKRRLRCVTRLDPDAPELRRGLRKVYGRARALAQAAAQAEAHHSELHRCRRWVKYLGYQLELATGVRGKQGAPLQQALTELGSTLGSIQDLVVLEQHLDSLAADPDLRAAVRVTRKLLKSTCKRLTRKANGMLAACFAATPREFAAMLG